MATYKGTKGFTVQILASDPTSESTVGLLFFNSTDNEFKYAGSVDTKVFPSPVFISAILP